MTSLEFTYETDNYSENYIQLVETLLIELGEYVGSKQYGEGLELIGVHLRLLKVQKGFEGFFKVKKPKYKKQFRNSGANSECDEVNGYFTYEILFSEFAYRNLCSEDPNEFKKLIGKEIVASLDNFEKLPKNLKTFNVQAFVDDVKGFFIPTN